MRKKLARWLLTASLGLGVCSFAALSARGDPPCLNGGPNCPAPGGTPIIPAPGTPSSLPGVLPGAQPAQPGTQPGTQPGAQAGAQPGAAGQAQPGAGEAAAGAGAEAAAAAAAPGGEAAGGEAAAASGAGDAAMLGRADPLNRFNLFDANNAAPITRVWGGYQREQGFQTNARPGPDLHLSANGATQAFQSNNVNVYRAGAEYAFSDRFSIAGQAEYLNYSELSSSWGNPEFLAKYVVARDCNYLLTAILGYTPETSYSLDQFRDKRSRLTPGALAWLDLGNGLFMQAAFQVGIGLADDSPLTVDYGVSVGYWLYRAPHLDCCDMKSRPFLCGIIPQVEIYGDNVLAQGTFSNATDGQVINPAFPNQGVIVDEQRNVYDVSVGGQILLRSFAVGLGYSFPITGAKAREDEFIASVQYRF
jgi:hypothetical protein